VRNPDARAEYGITPRSCLRQRGSSSCS
jgi:hypothetical protein